MLLKQNFRTPRMANLFLQQKPERESEMRIRGLGEGKEPPHMKLRNKNSF